MNRMRLFLVPVFFAAAIVMAESCAAVDTRKEGEILKRYSDESQSRYADLLVDVSRYTSNGALYHEKYRKLLIGLAAEVVEAKKLIIVPGTVGFYFDKKSDDRQSLFLGLDIDVGTGSVESYNSAAAYLVRHNLRDLIAIVHSCVSIFAESEIVGMVVGWRWTRQGAQEQVNIWIDKADLMKFENKRLTFDELVQRSVVTNSEGKIIRLQL